MGGGHISCFCHFHGPELLLFFYFLFLNWLANAFWMSWHLETKENGLTHVDNTDDVIN